MRWHERDLLNRLSFHAIALALVLLVLVAVIGNGVVGFTDEGAYGAQAASLADGSWATKRPVPDIDPSGEFFAVRGSLSRGSKSITYARQPLYPLLLTPFYVLGGITGMMVLSAVGTWLAAIAAAQIAGQIDPRLTIWTLWAVGVGSPLLFDATLVIGHSLVAAAAGVAGFCVLTACQREGWAVRSAWLFGSLVAATIAVLLRSEGVIAMGALGLCVAVSGLGVADRRPRLESFRLVSGVTLVVMAVIAYEGNARWVAVITDGVGRTGGSIARETDPLSVVWLSLVRPWTSDNRQASTAMVLALALVIFGSLLLRLLPAHPVLSLAMFITAAAATAMHLLEPQDLISGLFAATPLLLAGMFLLPPLSQWSFPIPILVGATLITTIVITWTTYSAGGATEWGGRFFHVMLPFCLPVAVFSVARAVSSTGNWTARTVVVSLAAMSLLLSLSAVRVSMRFHNSSRAVVKGTEAFIREHGMAGDTLVVHAPLSPSGSARIFWEVVHDGAPVIATHNLGELVELLPTIKKSGRNRFVIVTTVDKSVLNFAIRQSGIQSEWEVQDVQPLTGSSNFVAIIKSKD